MNMLSSRNLCFWIQKVGSGSIQIAQMFPDPKSTIASHPSVSPGADMTKDAYYK